MIETTTNGLAVLTVIGQILIVALLFEVIRTRKGSRSSPLLSVAKDNIILLSFFVASVAVLGSLFFSEIAQYEPCKFCWIQRILMYPLVVVFGLALIKKTRDAHLYGLVLSVVGMFVAAYHYLMQVDLITPTTCSAVGYASSCADSFTLTFGYITIPLMALTAFVLITIFTLLSFYHD